MNIVHLIGLSLISIIPLLLWFVGKRYSLFVLHSLLVPFSGAYLLGLVFTHMLPEMFMHSQEDISFTHGHLLGVIVLLGYFTQVVLDFFSRGLEHGHAHGNINLGMISALALHSFFEAIPISNYALLHDGSSQLLIGICLHKIPVGLVLISMIGSRTPKKSALLYLGIFMLSAPLGYIFGAQDLIPKAYFSWTLAFVVGLLLHISTTILFENNSSHTFNLKKVCITLVGFFLAFLGTLGDHIH